MKLNSAKTEKILFAAVTVILCLYFAVFAYINFQGFARVAQPDMYEDTLIAKLMWEQKTLFPDGYVFGNQFYVIATPVLAALFYGLTGSVNTGMGLATSVMSLLIVLSFIWMLRPAAGSRLAAASGLLVLAASVFSPDAVSFEQGQLLFTMCSFYACYLITLFFVFGDYLRARESGALRPAALTFALLLSFATGMQSARQTCIMTLPLLAFEALMLLRRLLRREPLKAERAPLLRSVAYLSANLAGLLFIRLLNIPHQTIFTSPEEYSRLTALWRAMRTITNYDNVMVAKNPLFMLMLVFYLGLLVLSAVIVVRNWRQDFKASHKLWLLSLISIAAVAAASLLTSVSVRGIYLFVYYPLLALSFVIVFERYSGKPRVVLVGLVCLLSLCNLPLSYGDTLNYISLEAPTDREQICGYALENGYKYIYGQDVCAPGVAVYSDGELIAGVWQQDVVFKAIPYLNIRTIYQLDDYDKALFVFLDEELPQVREEIAGNGAELTEVGRFGPYTVCTSSKQLMYPLTWVSDWPGYFNSLKGDSQ